MKHTYIIGLLLGLVVLAGCESKVEPRVIADRVFPADRLAVTFTSYPGQPRAGLVVTKVTAGLGSDAFRHCSTTPTTVEGAPAVRVELLPAEGADRIVSLCRVTYNSSEYEVATEFRRREVTLPAEGGRVTRWVTVDESVRDLGTPRAAAPRAARGYG